MNETTYRVDWEELKRDWPSWTLIVVTFALAFWAYPHLPERVATHFDLQGNPDGYSSRAVAAFVLPLVNLGVYTLLLVAPLVDPKRQNYARFGRFYRVFRQLVLAVLSVVYFVVICAGLGYAVTVDVGWVVTPAVSLLFIFLGNSLGRVRHNYFIGIRTPWTLADERVWQKSHRFAGRLMVVMGIFPLVALPFSRVVSFWLLIGGAVTMALASGAYSYFVYRRLHRDE